MQSPRFWKKTAAEERMAMAFGHANMTTPLTVSSPGNTQHQQKPRYSPGRRALSQRSVNSVWNVAATPTPSKKMPPAFSAESTPPSAQQQNPAPSPAETPRPGSTPSWIAAAIAAGHTPELDLSAAAASGSQAAAAEGHAGWIQHAAALGHTPEVGAVLRAAPAHTPRVAARRPGGSPRLALHSMLAVDVLNVLKDSSPAAAATPARTPARTPQEEAAAIEAAVASAMRQATNLTADAGGTPAPSANPHAHTPLGANSAPPTLSNSGGFDLTETPVPKRQGGSPPLRSERISPGRRVSQLGVGGVPCDASAPLAWLATASPVAATPTQAERCAPPQPSSTQATRLLLVTSRTSSESSLTSDEFVCFQEHRALVSIEIGP